VNPKVPKVKCATCDGSGEVEITQRLYDTLQIVKRQTVATSFSVWKDPSFKDHVVVSAVTNRLDDLFRFGLLSRIRNGREWLYSVKKG